MILSIQRINEQMWPALGKLA